MMIHNRATTPRHAMNRPITPLGAYAAATLR